MHLILCEGLCFVLTGIVATMLRYGILYSFAVTSTHCY